MFYVKLANPDAFQHIRPIAPLEDDYFEKNEINMNSELVLKIYKGKNMKSYRKEMAVLYAL